MTSAPNRLQPLSGNKKYLTLLLAAGMLHIASCSSARKPARSEEKSVSKAESPKKEEPKIPEVKTESREARKHRQDDDSLNRIYPVVMKETYRVALVLPLYLRYMELSSSQKSASDASQDFYKGAMLAADTLKHCGTSLDLYILESDKEQDKLEILKDSIKNLDPDLVIGPLVESNVKELAQFCGKNRINLVSPMQSGVFDTCFDKTYYMESNAGWDAYANVAADLVKKKFPGYKAILINKINTGTNNVSGIFASKFSKKDLTVINFNGKGALTLNPEDSFAEKNIIFIPAKKRDDEVFVSAVISQFQTTDKEVVLVGMVPWLYFKSMDGELWEKFKVHLILPYYIDYTREDVKNFVLKYREKFNEEPGELAFRGFDEMLWYGRLLKKHGRYFQRHLEDEQLSLLHNEYFLEKNKECRGYRNNRLRILKFEEYHLQEVKF